MDISYKIFTGLMGDLNCMFTDDVCYVKPDDFPLVTEISVMLENDGEVMDTYKKNIVFKTLRTLHMIHNDGIDWRNSKKALKRAVKMIEVSVLYTLVANKKIKTAFDYHLYKNTVFGKHGDIKGFIEYVILKVKQYKR